MNELNPPPGLSTEAKLQRLNCLGGAVLLAEGKFDETMKQRSEREALIREIAATEDATRARALNAKTWVDRRTINELWAKLWPRVQRELVIRKVNL